MTDFRYIVERRSVTRLDGSQYVASIAGFNWLEDAEGFFKSLDHNQDHITYWMYETTANRHLVRTSHDETSD